MSVQRTPPGALLLPNTSKTGMEHYNSDSALNTANNTHAEDLYFNITKRHKRTFDDIEAHSSTNISEIKALFENKFEILNNTLLTLLKQNQDIQNVVTTMSKKHDELLTKINVLEQENNALKNQMTTLKMKVETLEKHKQSSSLEIRNLPKQKDETKEVLTQIMKDISSTLGLKNSISETEIKNIFRTKSETIVVDFTTAHRKELLISSYKAFNKNKRQGKKPSLNSEHLKLPGPIHTIYIAESLTEKTRRLYYLAREGVKNKKLLATWTSFGKVYVKKEESGRSILVKEEDDLQSIIL